MPCIVPTCAAKAGTFRSFPRQNDLCERWIESIQRGCGMALCLDDIELREWDVCEWHFGESSQRKDSGGQLVEPRQFTDYNGKTVETASCRMCLVFFDRSDLVDTNGTVGDQAIKSIIFEMLEIDLQARGVSSLVCIGCLARLEVMAKIRNDFLNAEIKLHHLMKLAERTELGREECGLESKVDLIIKEQQINLGEQQDDEQSDEWPDDEENLKEKLSGTGGRKCYICPVVLEDKLELQSHLLDVHASEYTTCKECSTIYSNVRAYNKHLARHDASERPHKCDYCSMRFSCPSNRSNHQKTVHNPAESKPTAEQFVCEICEKPYISKDGLLYHMKTKHSIEQKHPCKICKKNFRTKRTLEMHMAVHTGERRRQCLLCPQTFGTYSAWYAHSVQHTDRFACKECGQRFPASQHLRAHMERVHSDGRLWECAECPGKLFKTSIGLRSHMIITHRKNQPFLCDFCSRSFKRKDLLDNHRRIHTGEKPFECGNCDMRFGSRPTAHHHRKRCLSRVPPATTVEEDHINLNTDKIAPSKHPRKRNHSKANEKSEGQYECEYCQKPFLRKEYLMNHRRSHTGETPFRCNNCTLRFSDRSAAYRHRKFCGQE